MRRSGCPKWRADQKPASRARHHLTTLVRRLITGEADYPRSTWSCPHCQRPSGGPMVSRVSFPASGLSSTREGGEPVWHCAWPDSRCGFCVCRGSRLRPLLPVLCAISG
ncbi:hypothetical protein Sliba_75570 [Streptomyces nigrescens]|uniref:Uncharacterized protein n=1 Tax=Streptomyces nigrescens TaxID=1920 RepID=A0A640TVC4_STRNI|nr:hypothetical protein Sliba_75570 [Streptomyces libani subsp. libani]GGV97048.1 hypothetical protein GCM10010500_41490 [Streptomyces libani subsp. libani]